MGALASSLAALAISCSACALPPATSRHSAACSTSAMRRRQASASARLHRGDARPSDGSSLPAAARTGRYSLFLSLSPRRSHLRRPAAKLTCQLVDLRERLLGVLVRLVHVAGLRRVHHGHEVHQDVQLLAGQPNERLARRRAAHRCGCNATISGLTLVK